MSNFRTGLQYSILAHALLIFLLMGGIKGCGGGNGSGDSDKKGDKQGMKDPDKRQIAEKPSTMQVELVEVPPEDKGITVKKPKFTARDCGANNWFGGIGIQIGYGDHGVVADHVYKGYPGYKAGLQDGDILINWDKLRGDPGSEIVIQVSRNGQLLTLPTVREKICLEQGEIP